jgi:hypothetical protein
MLHAAGSSTPPNHSKLSSHIIEVLQVEAQHRWFVERFAQRQLCWLLVVLLIPSSNCMGLNNPPAASEVADFTRCLLLCSATAAAQRRSLVRCCLWAAWVSAALLLEALQRTVRAVLAHL